MRGSEHDCTQPLDFRSCPKTIWGAELQKLIATVLVLVWLNRIDPPPHRTFTLVGRLELPSPCDKHLAIRA